MLVEDKMEKKRFDAKEKRLINCNQVDMKNVCTTFQMLCKN